jgi:hypothetical protein
MNDDEHEEKHNTGDETEPSDSDLEDLFDDSASADPSSLREFGELADHDVITEEELADAFGKHPISIKRALERGELPPPVRFLGKRAWTAGAIRKHLQNRLTEALDEHNRTTSRIRRLSP